MHLASAQANGRQLSGARVSLAAEMAGCGMARAPDWSSNT
jgi:hypothetical protein